MSDILGKTFLGGEFSEGDFAGEAAFLATGDECGESIDLNIPFRLLDGTLAGFASDATPLSVEGVSAAGDTGSVFTASLLFCRRKFKLHLLSGTTMLLRESSWSDPSHSRRYRRPSHSPRRRFWQFLLSIGV